MSPLHTPIFVLARSGELPKADLSWPALEAAQARAVTRARRLKIYTSPPNPEQELQSLVGSVTGHQRPLCDALVPEFAIRELSLGVYDLVEGPGVGPAAEQPIHPRELGALTCLDELQLAEIANEACWFYPTDTGTYLACSTEVQVVQRPGHQPEQLDNPEPFPYRRDQLRLLWSLLGGDESLTCVGLTYGGQRIDWPTQTERPAAVSTWTWFAVDAASEVAYRELKQTQLRTDATTAP